MKIFDKIRKKKINHSQNLFLSFTQNGCYALFTVKPSCCPHMQCLHVYTPDGLLSYTKLQSIQIVYVPEGISCTLVCLIVSGLKLQNVWHTDICMGYQPEKSGDLPFLSVFASQNWKLLIYSHERSLPRNKKIAFKTLLARIKPFFTKTWNVYKNVWSCMCNAGSQNWFDIYQIMK